MTAADDYPELEQITRGTGVSVLEDAEDQAARALEELDLLRDCLNGQKYAIADLLAEVEALNAKYAKALREAERRGLLIIEAHAEQHYDPEYGTWFCGANLCGWDSVTGNGHAAHIEALLDPEGER